MTGAWVGHALDMQLMHVLLYVGIPACCFAHLLHTRVLATTHLHDALRARAPTSSIELHLSMPALAGLMADAMA